jgi:hypothetical protein
MNKIIAFLIIPLIPLVLWAMKPITESDLSNVSSPASLPISSNSEDLRFNDLKIRFDFQIFEEDIDVTNKTYVTAKFSHFFLISPKNNISYVSVKNYMLNPITLQDDTLLISAEDSLDPYKLRYTPPEITHSMSYPIGQTNSSNTPYTYIIRSGDIEMRDTYINNTSTNIIPNSWVDIKPH